METQYNRQHTTSLSMKSINLIIADAVIKHFVSCQSCWCVFFTFFISFGTTRPVANTRRIQTGPTQICFFL